MLGFQWAQCRRARPVLWDYASERLSEGPMELVEQHLQSCHACRAEVVTLQRAQQFLSACRAEEEPAPRSDWNALRQRIVEENVTPLRQAAFASASIASGQDMAQRGLRASWQMPLITFTAGGFATVLALGVVYMLRPGSVAPNPFVAPSLAASIQIGKAASLQASADVDSGMRRISQSGVDKTGLIAAIARVPDETRVTPDATPAPSPVLPVATAAAPAKSEQSSVVRLASNTARQHSPTAKTSGKEHDTRIAQNTTNTAARADGKFHFRPYTPKPQERLTTLAQATEGASHYALERVRPVNTENDEAGAYVVGSVRPVSYEESGDY